MIGAFFQSQWGGFCIGIIIGLYFIAGYLIANFTDPHSKGMRVSLILFWPIFVVLASLIAIGLVIEHHVRTISKVLRRDLRK